MLEDLHWADEATLDVVQLLGRRAARLPALVIGTYRDDELGRSHPLRVVLGGLGAVERIVVQPLSPAAVDRLASERGVDGAGLHARTGGNPFFVTEVLAHGNEVAPGSVRDAVTARAARLPASARQLLEAVAIGRPRSEIWLLESIAAVSCSSSSGAWTRGCCARRVTRWPSGTTSNARPSRTACHRTGA